MTESTLNYQRATNPNRNGTPVGFQVLTAPVKEFKRINHKISTVIGVKPKTLFSEVWEGWTTKQTQKYTKVKVQMTCIFPTYIVLIT